MNFWFMAWIFFSVFIFGIFLWSIKILLQQKQCWKQFAAQHKLAYANGPLFSSATVRGQFRGYDFSLISEAQQDDGARGRKYRSIIQIELPGRMPTEAIVASEGLRGRVEAFRLPEKFMPDLPDWNKKIYFQTANHEALSSYITPDRARALNTLMSAKGANALFVFNPSESILRFETPDPLTDVQKLERLAVKMIETAQILDPALTRAA